MQEQRLDELIMESLSKPLDKPRTVKTKMNRLAARNKKDLSFMELPEYLRIPTGEELTEMRQWAIDHKKANPRISKRQLRKATQEHFKIRIYK